MSAILARLISDLDIAVFERAQDETYTLLSNTPEWLESLWPGLQQNDSGLAPGDRFYFLEDFLDRNASFWETPADKKNTSGVWVETTKDEEEQLLQAVTTFIDNHPLLLLRVPNERETWPIYQRAREQRLEYEQLLDEINKREVLLHCIVHDLSNPLAGIKGSLNLLQTEQMVESEGDELVKIGLKQANKMQDLIKSILSTFANEVKPIVPTLIGADVAPDIHATADEVVQSLNATAALKGVALQLEPIPAGTEMKVTGEAERLERVLYNLLVNAIRHSSAGQTITVRTIEDGDFIETSVEDQGAGVPADLVDGLFDRFSQGADHTGQVGLGLYFCKITVEGWGGSIGYAPTNSGSARFWFKLPKPVKHADAQQRFQHS